MARQGLLWQDSVCYGKTVLVMARQCLLWQDGVCYGKTVLVMGRQCLLWEVCVCYNVPQYVTTGWAGIFIR